MVVDVAEVTRIVVQVLVVDDKDIKQEKTTVLVHPTLDPTCNILFSPLLRYTFTFMPSFLFTPYNKAVVYSLDQIRLVNDMESHLE